MTSNIKRKEEKDYGMEADLSPFKRLRINVLGPRISQEKLSKYKEEAVKNLRKQGQLKLSIYMNCGMLTINVIRARNLYCNHKATCDSVVKISLIPDEQKRTKYSTKMVLDSNNPVYDDKISFELLQDDISKRLLISVWHIDQSDLIKVHLGSMSFGVLHLMKPNKCIDGWYHLLNEKVGRNKHLLVPVKVTPELQMRGLHGIPLINKDLWGMESLVINVDRGKSGYGFSVVDGCPVIVSRVDTASPAAEAGLKVNDRIAKVNGRNVSRSIAVSVAKLVKNSKYKVTLDIQRPMTYENLEKSPWRWKCKDDDKSDEINKQNGSIEQNAAKENEVSVDEDLMLGNDYKMATSTPFPGKLDRKIFRLNKPDMSENKAAATQQLVELEREFINFMHEGIAHYSRPLRHCILSQKQHSELFQNIEKLVTLSEYLMKQLQYNMPSSSSTETDDASLSDTDSNIIHNVGLIYKSKLQMIYQAYKSYAQGLGQANTVLKDLQNNANFKMFLKECFSAVIQTSISAFISRPSQHIKEVYQTLREIFCNTPQENSDYLNLKLVVEGLQLCTTYITNYTCMRAQKLSLSSSSSSSYSLSISSGSVSSYTNSSLSGTSAAAFDGNPSEKPKSSVCTMNGFKDNHSEGKLQLSNTVCVKKERASISYIRNLKPSSKSNLGQTSSNCSEDSSHSIDSQLSSIQKKLYFPDIIPYFQLCQEDRHLIYSGDIFRWDGDVWNKLQLMLFSDMLLQTEKSSDGRLTVVESPIKLHSLQGIGSQRKHATDFILHVTCSSDKPSNMSKKLMFRAPDIEQKYTWKTLIEQRILNYQSGSLVSVISSDISGSSGVIV
ncbi:uncharacterized protein LOC115231791 [Argonauta hians]